MWFNSTTGELYVWYDDGQPDNDLRGKQWVQALGGGGSGGGGILEAPDDGNIHGRQNKNWNVITGGGGGTTYNFIEPIHPRW